MWRFFLERLLKGGVINRNISVPIIFNGKAYSGYLGDSLASALMGNGIKIFNQSASRLRARGIISAGSLSENANFEFSDGTQSNKFISSLFDEIYSGLNATSERAIEFSQIRDLIFNDFKDGTSWLKNQIRARLGLSLSRESLFNLDVIANRSEVNSHAGNNEISKLAFTYCDVLVVGFGFSGLIAAIMASRSGARVIVLERDFCLDTFAVNGCFNSSDTWRANILKELHEAKNVRFMLSTTLIGIHSKGVCNAIQKQRTSVALNFVHWQINTKFTVLCTGASERSVAFPNNDRPGIMLASAVKTYLKRFAVCPGKRITVFTNNDSGWETAAAAIELGVKVEAVIDSRIDSQNSLDCVTDRGAVVVDTYGKNGLTKIKIKNKNGGMNYILTDCLAVSGGWDPLVYNFSGIELSYQWQKAIQAYTVDNEPKNLKFVGSAKGTFNLRTIISETRATMYDVVSNLGGKTYFDDNVKVEEKKYTISSCWITGKDTSSSWVDYNKDITVSDLIKYRDVGMSISVGSIQTSAFSIPDTDELERMIIDKLTKQGVTKKTVDPKRVKKTMRCYEIIRYKKLHKFLDLKGASWKKTDDWLVASRYSQSQDLNWYITQVREVQTARSTIAYCDDSHFEKIEIYGQNAANFLKLIFVDSIDKMSTGQVFESVFFDCLGEAVTLVRCIKLGMHHFFLIAKRSIISELKKVIVSDFKGTDNKTPLRILDVTDQWDQFLFVGPKALLLLNKIFGKHFQYDRLDWPQVIIQKILGVKARVLITEGVSGTKFEILIPNGSSLKFMKVIDFEVQTLKGCIFGEAAREVLRIEDGLVSDNELKVPEKLAQEDFDDFYVPHFKFSRDLITSATNDSYNLYFFVPVGDVKSLNSGSLIFKTETMINRKEAVGFLTSSCFSPTVGTMIGIGFIFSDIGILDMNVLVFDKEQNIETHCKVSLLSGFTGGM